MTNQRRLTPSRSVKRVGIDQSRLSKTFPDMSFSRTVQFLNASEPNPVRLILGDPMSACYYEPDELDDQLSKLKVKQDRVLKVDVATLKENVAYVVELLPDIPGEMKFYVADDGDIVVTSRRLKLSRGIPGEKQCDEQCFHEFMDGLSCRHELNGVTDFDEWR